MSDFYCFFMSYANEDNVDQEKDFVQVFFKSLKSSLKTRTSSTEIGFLDRHGLDIGDDWSRKLAKGIRTCKTFIPLLTTRYFTRPFCGLEWGGFMNRCKDITSAEIPPLIIPILWDVHNTGDLPSWVLKSQFSISEKNISAALSDKACEALKEYSETGILKILKRKDHSDSYFMAYDELVSHVAEKIISLERIHSLPNMEESQLEDIKDAPQGFPNLRTPTAGSSRNTAQFAVIVGSHSEMLGKRNNAENYYPGRDPLDWIPYSQSSQECIALIAQRASLQQRVRAEWLDSRSNLVEQIQKLEEEKQPVLVVIDPWSAIKLKNTYEDIIREFDRINFDNCVIFIVWDEKENDTIRTQLTAQLKDSFLRFKLNRLDVFVYDNVESDKALLKAMDQGIEDLRHRLVQTMKPRYPGTKGRYDAPPTV